MLRGRLCERIWNGKYTFLVTYKNREIYFPRNLSPDISRENSFAVNTLALANGEWDVTERDEIGRNGMGLDGKGRDSMERDGTGRSRDRTGWRGTRHDREGRDR